MWILAKDRWDKGLFFRLRITFKCHLLLPYYVGLAWRSLHCWWNCLLEKSNGDLAQMLMVLKHEASVHLSACTQPGDRALYLEGGDKLCKQNAVSGSPYHHANLCRARQPAGTADATGFCWGFCLRCCQHYALMHELRMTLVTTLFIIISKPTTLSTWGNTKSENRGAGVGKMQKKTCEVN